MLRASKWSEQPTILSHSTWSCVCPPLRKLQSLRKTTKEWVHLTFECIRRGHTQNNWVVRKLNADSWYMLLHICLVIYFISLALFRVWVQLGVRIYSRCLSLHQDRPQLVWTQSRGINRYNKMEKNILSAKWWRKTRCNFCLVTALVAIDEQENGKQREWHSRPEEVRWETSRDLRECHIRFGLSVSDLSFSLALCVPLYYNFAQFIIAKWQQTVEWEMEGKSNRIWLCVMWEGAERKRLMNWNNTQTQVLPLALLDESNWFAPERQSKSFWVQLKPDAALNRSLSAGQVHVY